MEHFFFRFLRFVFISNQLQPRPLDLLPCKFSTSSFYLCSSSFSSFSLCSFSFSPCSFSFCSFSLSSFFPFSFHYTLFCFSLLLSLLFCHFPASFISIPNFFQPINSFFCFQSPSVFPSSILIPVILFASRKGQASKRWVSLFCSFFFLSARNCSKNFDHEKPFSIFLFMKVGVIQKQRLPVQVMIPFICSASYSLDC